jgi:hypothetical protein
LGGDVLPVARSAGRPVATGSCYRVPSAFNRAILAQGLSRNYAVVLASPVAGTGVGISILHTVALRRLVEARPEERTAWIRGFVEANPLRAWDHGRPLDSKAEVMRLLGAELEQFRATRLPKLVELGIVEALE